jgi:CMP-N,N'-diacetyllegionaminic acid synthase
VPFLRPENIADEFTGDFEVVEHFINWIKNNEKCSLDQIIYLRPDYPFRKPEIIDKAISVYTSDEKSEGLRSIQKSKEIPY